MNVTISYILSETGQKALILVGGNGASDQKIEVAPDSPEFARALEAADVRSDGTAVLNLATWQYPSWDHVPTAAELLDYLAAKKAERRAKEEAKAAELQARTLAVLTERRTSRRSETIRWHEERRLSDTCNTLLSPDWPYGADATITQSPEALAWQAELDAENNRRKAEFIAVQQAQFAERQQAAAKAAAEVAARRLNLGLEEGDEAFSFEDGALVSVPIWSDHKRSRTWMAVIEINPKSPGGLDRSFAEKAKGDFYYIVPSLNPGDPIEFGADYYSGSGRKSADRWYGYVVRIDPETETTRGVLVLHKCATGKSAVTSGKKFAASLAAKA